MTLVARRKPPAGGSFSVYRLYVKDRSLGDEHTERRDIHFSPNVEFPVTGRETGSRYAWQRMLGASRDRENIAEDERMFITAKMTIQFYVFKPRKYWMTAR
jgi:hypothetical protein